MLHTQCLSTLRTRNWTGWEYSLRNRFRSSAIRILDVFSAAAAAAEEADADAAAVVDPDGAVPWWSESDSESLENSGSGMLNRAMRRWSSSWGVLKRKIGNVTDCWKSKNWENLG